MHCNDTKEVKDLLFYLIVTLLSELQVTDKDRAQCSLENLLIGHG